MKVHTKQALHMNLYLYVLWIHANSRLNSFQLTMNRDQKLLNQLGFSDEQSLTVKSSGTGTPSGSSADSSASASSSSSGVFNSAYAMEQVHSLTGLITHTLLMLIGSSMH